MKSLASSILILIALFACNKGAQNTETTKSPDAPSDSVAIADAVHGFYKWYTAFSQDTTKRIDFTDDSGQHLTLNQAKLERYYANFKNTGFVSDEFIANEYEFYKKCSKLWQNELIDEVPSCMDADKYFCAQDWEPDFWIKSPVRIKNIGSDKVLATLYGIAFGGSMERNIELKKENGKWLITKVECDMGADVTEIQLKNIKLDEKYFTAKAASSKALSDREFTRLELGNIISDDVRKAPNTKIFVMDTLFSADRGTIVIVARDSENEAEAWMVQYGGSPKIQFWDQVYYADLVEYMKTINTTVSGKEVVIRTTTDVDGSKSTKQNKYVLSNQLIFERDN